MSGTTSPSPLIPLPREEGEAPRTPHPLWEGGGRGGFQNLFIKSLDFQSDFFTLYLLIKSYNIVYQLNKDSNGKSQWLKN